MHLLCWIHLGRDESKGVIEVFDLQKSLGEVKKQLIIPGAVQLDGVKLTDPAATFKAQSGQILRLSKKHSVKIV